MKEKNLSKGLTYPAFLTGQKVKHNGLLFYSVKLWLKSGQIIHLLKQDMNILVIPSRGRGMVRTQIEL